MHGRIFLFEQNEFINCHYFYSRRLPPADLWNLYMNMQTRRLDLWIKIMPEFEYKKDTPFFNIVVPTINTIRFGYIMEKLIMINMPVLFTGNTG